MPTKQQKPSEAFSEAMQSDDFTDRHHAAEHAIIGGGDDESKVVIIAAMSKSGHLIAITLESPDMCRVMAEGLLMASRTIFGTDECQAKTDA